MDRAGWGELLIDAAAQLWAWRVQAGLYLLWVFTVVFDPLGRAREPHEVFVGRAKRPGTLHILRVNGGEPVWRALAYFWRGPHESQTCDILRQLVSAPTIEVQGALTCDAYELPQPFWVKIDLADKTVEFNHSYPAQGECPHGPRRVLLGSLSKAEVFKNLLGRGACSTPQTKKDR